MEYISTHVRQQIIEKYQGANPCAETDEELDEILFGYPANRILVDEAIKAANEQVDLERFQQFDPGWYCEVVSALPPIDKLRSETSKLITLPQPQTTMHLSLSEDTLVYLGAMILLTTRSFTKTSQEDCIEAARDVFSAVFKK